MFVPLIAAGTVGKLRHWPDLLTYGVGMALAALTGAIILTRMGWWKTAGFRRPRRLHLIWIFVVTIVIDVINNWSGSLPPQIPQLVGLTLMMTLFGAFSEEVFYRGLMLRVLMTRGVRLAAIVTSILFGLSHLTNAAAGMSPEVVLWQLFYATGYGLAYAAFAIRTGTIWPIILTHFLGNFSILTVSGWAVQTQEVSTSDQWVNAIYAVAFTAYGIILIRKHRKEQSALSIDPNPAASPT
jgi:membrane protease YdiL (CAAX protease family)